MDIARVDARRRQYALAAPTLDRTISPADDMFAKSGGWDSYVGVGRSSVDLILEALVLGDLRQVRTVLDFGCGHGRTARHLPLLFPDATPALLGHRRERLAILRFTAWGQHLASIGRVTSLASDREDARLIGYKQTGWAGIHDVGVWSKNPGPRG